MAADPAGCPAPRVFLRLLILFSLWLVRPRFDGAISGEPPLEGSVSESVFLTLISLAIVALIASAALENPGRNQL